MSTTAAIGGSAKYTAPFAPGGSAAVDAALCGRLLSVALANGGDYADLFFEYRAGGGFVFDEGILKSASRGVSVGLGVRVQRGDATGYAYTEDLSWDSMKRAAETAAQIASGGGGKLEVTLRKLALPKRYELSMPTIDAPGAGKRELLERASRTAHEYDPSIVKAEAPRATA
jgi:TldD protein